MNEKFWFMFIFFFTSLYLVFFTSLTILYENYAFLVATFLILGIGWFVLNYHKKIKFPLPVLGGLSFMGFIHFLGAYIFINGIRLYDFWLIPKILRYDNLLHLFGPFVITFAVYYTLSPYLDKKIINNRFWLCLLLVLVVSGLGAIFEIIELFYALFFDAADQIGSYLNNAFDLLCNLLGSIVACLVLTRRLPYK